MKKVCLLCERTSPDDNLFCQEAFCPAEMSPYILDYGEWLGDIEITRSVSTLRSSALYEAQHNGQKVLLKIAHPGPEHTERLKRETKLLQAFASNKRAEPTMPQLLPPYANTTIDKDQYGKAMLKGQLLYFCLFEHFEGAPLRDILIKTPQLWIYHIGWLMLSLASTVALLHNKGVMHCGLSPEVVLVRFEEASAEPQILLADMGIVSDRQGLAENWYPEAVLPAYTAPELLAPSPQANYATDVYGLGLILYELLVGQPVFPFKLSNDDDIYAAVRLNQRVRMDRFEDVKEVADMAVRAISPAPSDRQQNAADMAAALLPVFGNTPSAKRGSWLQPRTALILIAALLALTFLITVVIFVYTTMAKTSTG
jgi:serine/threonine protein kinase